MNYKLLLSATAVAALGLTGCNSKDTARDYGRTNYDLSKGGIQSGTTSDGTRTTTAPAADSSATTTTTTTSTTSPTYNKTASSKDIRHAKHRHAMRKHSAVAPTSGGSSPDTTSINDNKMGTTVGYDEHKDVYHQNQPVAATAPAPASKGHVSYSQTPNRGGIAPQDRNLRFGLVGNGTGIGTEDTTSKFMTDNGTLADPLVKHDQSLSTGALSAPTQDEDQLKDIKSGTSFDYYDIEP